MNGSPIKTRALKRSALMGSIIIAVFGLLLLRILLIQTAGFEKYQRKVIDQMTTQTVLPANRGKILDRNGNILATNETTYLLSISPAGIKSAEEKEGKNYTKIVSTLLSDPELLEGVSYEEVEKHINDHPDKLYREIKRKISEEDKQKIATRIKEAGLDEKQMIYLNPQSTRAYPSGSLASHVLGFSNGEGDGVCGLELQYDKYLSGVDGYYVTARDTNGNIVPDKYTSRIDAIDGYNVTTTIDSTIQSILEEQLEATVNKHEVENRACGIVMDVKTGAILGMATSSPFDLENPYGMLTDDSYEDDAEGQYQILIDNFKKILKRCEGQDNYNEVRSSILTTIWSNKAVTESYIPGSTFKIVTSSMALDEDEVKLSESVYCNGYLEVSDRKIHCHVRTGHGPLDFGEGLQQSCNVWFMTLGQRLGIARFCDYVEIFGYTQKTGIDLPGEGNSIFAAEEDMGTLDLSIYAFGQNFNVTPIQQITAISSVANGGTLLTPYIVEKISDNSGNTIYEHKVEAKRNTVSEETCKTISAILEDGVSGDGGANKAYVAGYRVAAKTGTSEKKERECPECGFTGKLTNVVRNEETHEIEEKYYTCTICKYEAIEEEFEESEKYICSTVAYAPADDPQIAVIIIVDEPIVGSLYGSSVAAPYVSKVLESTLPHLGVAPLYTEKELEKMATTVGGYVGETVEDAIASIKERGLRYKIIGEVNGDSEITAQSPSYGTQIDKTQGIIYLYTAEEAKVPTVTVPDLSGMEPQKANQILVSAGLNIRVKGCLTYFYGNDYEVESQSVEPGSQVRQGRVITVTFKKKS